ncbi:calponin domain-containing protein [Fimicolochytrium jonesii]|uniref:calponin domain-containing protein n=1 Tax=Fimicolochytrium jonesii TaxID=1396493 RepID=UPI0022FE250B|nr:calponin domain-containing protein [Fimicolochytrium jonesii]KAI8820878.1 calponin homology domain-containing protein [Fimicolochytrium jonesii]
MGESRTELLAWLNDLLQLGYTKIEQCGTGAAHCQIIDSIYRDLPVSKVKFNAKHEYEYVANFKILQNAFDKHKIDNAIPVERLIKCKFQDNLEFLQWVKKFWDNYYPGGTYDAVARRGGAGAGAGAAGGGFKTTTSNNKLGTPLKKAPSATAVRASRAGGGSTTNAGGLSRAAAASSDRTAELEAEYQKALQDMQQQVMEAKLTVEQVEKEREFYFSKLREIEIYVQEQLAAGLDGGAHDHVLQHISDVMYKTEDGFEIPQGGEGAQAESAIAGGEEETF